MRFCENCGSQINDNESTCPYCGAQSGESYVMSSGSQYTQNRNSYNQVQNNVLARNFEIPKNINQNYSSSQNDSNGSNHDRGSINIQRLIGSAGLSGTFITSAIAGIFLILMGLGLFILLATEADDGILVSFLLPIVFLPLNLFVIGQIMFICNAASKKEYLPTAGLTVMNVGIITMLVYEVLYVVGGAIYIIYWIHRISKRIRYAKQWGGYFMFDNTSELRRGRMWLCILLIVFIVIMVLSIISYAKSSGIIAHLKYMQRMEIIPMNNLSIYPAVMNFIKAGLMIIACIGILATGDDIGDETNLGIALMIIFIITIVIRVIFYIFTGASIISFNGKLTHARRIESQKR